MFWDQEQIEWAVEEGADFILAETFQFFGEAKLALECIKKYGKGNFLFCKTNYIVIINLNELDNFVGIW